MLDELAATAIRFGTYLPRGGCFLARHLVELRPRLRRHRFQTRYGPLVCDLSEPLCHPLLKSGEYSWWRDDMLFYDQLTLPKGAVVLDVGANIGAITRVLAGKAAHVHAFEPAPRAIPLLHATVSDLPNVSVHEVAVSDHSGMVCFNERPNLDMSSLSDTGISVPAVAIDDLDIRPALIKIDVEGYEHLVLKGARETLKSGPIVVFEALSPEALETNKKALLDANPSYRITKLGTGGNYVAMSP